MSEQRPHSQERYELHDQDREEAPSIETTRSDEQAAHKSIERLPVEELARRVEAHALSSRELQTVEESHTEPAHHPVFVNKHLKDTAYMRTMVRTRKKLSKPMRIFSQLLHSPLMDKPSEIAGKTVARPSGMLGGSICAFIGSLSLYTLVNTYGYTYNYLLAILLFFVGAVLGLAAEAIIQILRQK